MLGQEPKIQIIETEYKGYHFRSRTEARWAVFFDSMGIEWEYEPEGFKLEGGYNYLPDFYLPKLNIWVEVKGIFTDKDEQKLYRFENMNNIGAIYCVGQIPPDVDDIVEWVYDKYKDTGIYNNGFMDFPYLPCVCPTCGKFGFQFEGRGSRICRHDDDDKGYTYNNPKILSAYKAARQARFEHKETPVIGIPVDKPDPNKKIYYATSVTVMK